jgi:hypothetical protein
MDTDLPLLDHDRIARAAEGMIYNYGDGAMVEAARRAKTLRSSGCVSAAATWESICKLIQLRIDGYTPSEQSTGNYGHTHCPSHGGAFFWPSLYGE